MNRAPDPRLEEIADGIFAHIQPPGTWCLSNSAFLVGPRAVTVIDTTATESRARMLRTAIESVTPLPPRTVINTHHHGDHTYGNGVFAADATIIGHERCREEMAEQGMLLKALWTEVEWGDIEIVPPSVTFADRLTVYVGDLRVDLMHFGPAHTTNDVVAFVPDHDLLFAGDIVFNGGTPFIMMGSIAGTLHTLERLRELSAQTVVPGHGPVGGPELYDRTAAYARWLQELARQGISAGLGPLAVARETDLGEFGEWTDSERIVGNLHRAYAEERGGPLGERLDAVTIMMELAEYNGGTMPASLA